jgi:ABC-type branched-subunit amino acid transport system ATPase component/predicted MFS family arabinose efflux permease
MSEQPTEEFSASQLSATVLEEETRRAEEGKADSEVLFADELLPGVQSEQMSLKDGLKRGGPSLFVVLFALASLDELEGAALTVLAPDIRDTFGVSDGTIVFIAAASSAFITLGAIPMGYLADRYRRTTIVGISTLVFSGMVFLSGFAINAFMLFWTRFGAGIAKSNALPVHGSLLADAYPIQVRGRLYSLLAFGGRSMGVLSPLLVGVIAQAADPNGTEGWRWAYYLLGIPVAIVAVLAFFQREPIRGQNEKADVLGQVYAEEDPLPISMEAGFARLWQINTLRRVIIAFAALGFGLFTVGVLASLHLEQEYGLDTLGRGLAVTIAGVGSLIALPFVGKRFDRVYRTDPTRALYLIGLLIFPSALLIPLQYSMPTAALFVVFEIPRQILLVSALAMVQPILQSVVPYRLRGLGGSLALVYIFFVGATGGGLMAALLANIYSPKVAVIVLSVPSTLIGGAIVMSGAKFIRNDLSLIVGELREEQAEVIRREEDEDSLPVVQVNEIDFSYGQVQVLFGVAFEVAPGETLALLGTNGAGKSTILRVISGLGTPGRGVIRLDGRNITYTSPEVRSGLGIHQLPGGQGTFPTMSIYDNLVMGAYQYRRDSADVEARIERVFTLFPELGRRPKTMAGQLSGGQQQMLALARTLLHDPRLLIIDELSLGLAPTVVAELLETVERLREDGMTMIIVEQSLNVALAIADRAIFLEKGQVRFEGSAQELTERDDLARAVFLGTEGG